MGWCKKREFHAQYPQKLELCGFKWVNTHSLDAKRPSEISSIKGVIHWTAVLLFSCRHSNSCWPRHTTAMAWAINPFKCFPHCRVPTKEKTAYLAKLLHCVRTACALRGHCMRTVCILRTQRPGYSPKNTCHLTGCTAKQQSPHENDKTAFNLVLHCPYEQTTQPCKVRLLRVFRCPWLRSWRRQ